MENELNAICLYAEKLLSREFRFPVRLSILEQFESSHLVLRLAVYTDHADRMIPDRVILKKRNLARTQDPNKFDQTQLFSNEWASLDFMREFAQEKASGPRLYASEPANGMVLVEDLGKTPTLQEMLYSRDSRAAEAGLIDMAQTLGELQASTYGSEEGFIQRQVALQTNTPICDANLDCRDHLSELRDCIEELGLEIVPGFEHSLRSLEEAIHGSGKLRAFVHQDAGPHNFVVTPTGVRPIDFEFAGFGHCLLDIACVRLAFPPAFRGRVVPNEIIQAVENQYRVSLAGQIPELSEDEFYIRSLAQACAHWALSKLIGFWHNYLHYRLIEGEKWDSRDGRPPERAAFFRMQVFSYLRLALATIEEQDGLSEIRSGLTFILERLFDIWPETPLLSKFPAFGGEPWHYP